MNIKKGRKKKQSSFISFAISVAVLYAFYYLFIEPRAKTAGLYVGKQSPELHAYMLDVTAQLKEKSSSPVNTALIESAEEEWRNDPFYNMVYYGELALSETHIKAGYVTERDSFTYSGFLVCSDKKVAIINDMEYVVGETIILASGTYVLEGIFPANVIITNKGNSDRRIIQIQEMKE